MFSGPSKGPLSRAPRPAARRRRVPAGEIGGTRPSGGSITSELRRDALPRSSHVGGGDVAEPTCPALVNAIADAITALVMVVLLSGLEIPPRGVFEDDGAVDRKRPAFLHELVVPLRDFRRVSLLVFV